MLGQMLIKQVMIFSLHFNVAAQENQVDAVKLLINEGKSNVHALASRNRSVVYIAAVLGDDPQNYFDFGSKWC